MELKEIHDEWTKRFREFAQKSFRTEQALLLQVISPESSSSFSFVLTGKVSRELSFFQRESIQTCTCSFSGN